MKKIITIILCVALLMAFTACSKQDVSGADNEASPSEERDEVVETEDGAEVVLLISAAATLDDRSFNEACYKGIKDFAEETGTTYTYYQPTEDSVEAQIITCDTAIKAGAKFVVINSDQFRVAASEMQEKHPEVTFIIYDTVPESVDGTKVVNDNIRCILFAEHEASFIAGYAAVVDGYRSFGFLGGQAVPAVVRFGYGFVEGIEVAAKDLGLTKGDVEIKYGYTGNFEATAENQALAASWYQSGTEVIFACGGPMGASVFAAAEQNDGLVIGVDSDQSAESETIITSATKDLRNITCNVLKEWNEGQFKGGDVIVYGSKQGGVGLPMESSKFSNFTQDDYDKFYTRMANDVDGIASNLHTDSDFESPEELPLELTKLTYVQ